MSPFHALTLILAFIATLLPLASAAQQIDSELGVTPEPKKRPKIALVLSGGGARGFAHIGVLKVLKDLRIPIDMVVGTSMGAVVGGAYAAGRSVEELEQIVKNTSWESVLADRPARDQLDFRRRESLSVAIRRALPSRQHRETPGNSSGNAIISSSCSMAGATHRRRLMRLKAFAAVAAM